MPRLPAQRGLDVVLGQADEAAIEGHAVVEDPVAVAADLGAGEADQLPADHPAVAAMDRVAEEAGDRVRAQDLEEGLQAEDLAGRRGVLDRLRPGARELDRHVLDPDDAHHLVGLPAVHRAQRLILLLLG